MTIGQDDGEYVPTLSQSGKQSDPHHEFMTY